MAPLDSAPMLPDLAPGQPAGENLEFDPAFAELERLAAGKPEQQYGATIVPAEEPEWRDVVAAATALMDRTYDLRVMTHLATARLHSQGMGAYAETLVLVQQAVEARWDTVHPQLDPEDDLDPTLRANALLGLAAPLRVLRFLRHMPLARSPRAGTVCWRDVAVAAGTMEPLADAPRLSDATISGAFRDTDGAALDRLQAAVAQASACASAIPAAFDATAGHGTGPDFTDLVRLLRDIGQLLAAHAHAPGAEAPPAADAAPGAVPDAAPRAASFAASGANIATMGPPTTRADAMRLLDLVIAFYEANEPSSPLPLLIARARRLAEMGFMDILRDMAPEGVAQAETVAGTKSPE